MFLYRRVSIQTSRWLTGVRSTGDVRGHKHLKMSAFTGYACADGDAGAAEGKGDDTQGSDRASDNEGDHVDSGSVDLRDHGAAHAPAQGALPGEGLRRVG